MLPLAKKKGQWWRAIRVNGLVQFLVAACGMCVSAAVLWVVSVSPRLSLMTSGSVCFLLCTAPPSVGSRTLHLCYNRNQSTSNPGQPDHWLNVSIQFAPCSPQLAPDLTRTFTNLPQHEKNLPRTYTLISPNFSPTCPNVKKLAPNLPQLEKSCSRHQTLLTGPFSSMLTFFGAEQVWSKYVVQVWRKCWP